MRKYLILLWLLAPVALIYYHYGPGQRLLAYDNAADCIKRAESLEEVAKMDSSPENWQRVVEVYQQAGKLMGEENTLISRRIKLSSANALMYQGELYESMTQLETLLEDAIEDKMPVGYADQVRETLARCQFGAAWVMRLEGSETKDWTAQADKARQNFRLLAEESLGQALDMRSQRVPESPSGTKIESTEAIDHQKNLESTIRMAQLDASTIKGLPLPKEAKNGQGKGLSDKMGEKKEGEGEAPGIGETQDSDARGAGAGDGQRPQGIGS